MIPVSAVIALDCLFSWSNYLPTGNTTIVTHDYSFKYLKVFTDLPTFKTQKKKVCETLNQEPEKVVRNGYFTKQVVRCPKFPIGRTFRGDYEYWKPVAYYFKAGAVSITIIVYELGFVICMFYLRPSWEREQLHIWWQWQVARKASRMQSNATAKRFLWIQLAIYWYPTWKRTL